MWELQNARALLIDKFGKEFAQQAISNSDGKVAARVSDRLKIEAPKPELVVKYLEVIARAYDVEWPPKDKNGDRDDNGPDDGDDDDRPSGGQKVETGDDDPLTRKELNKATPPSDLSGRSPVMMAPQSPTSENPRPYIKLPSAPELRPGGKLQKAMGRKEEAVGDEMKDGAGAEAESGAGKTKKEKEKEKDSGSGSSSSERVPGRVPTYDDLAKRFAALKR